MKTATRTSLLAAAALVALGSLAAWGLVFSAPPWPAAADVLALLPRGSTLHSLVRLEMDGRPPAEAAAVARVPPFPGADPAPTALLVRYDRLRRRYGVLYRAAPPGVVPFSADGGRLLGRRDAAVFSGLRDDGTVHYRVLALRGGRPVVVREALIRGSLQVAEPTIVERGPRPVVLRWADGRWTAAPEAGRVPPPPPAVTWRYAVRDGAVAAPRSVVRLRLRQPLRVVAVGGGPATVVLPDGRLDLVESGYRARVPGTYQVRIVTGFTPPEAAYVLTVIVTP